MERKTNDYHLVSNDDDFNVDHVRQPQSHSRAARFVRLLILCVILLSTTVAGVALGSFHPLQSLVRPPTRAHATDCGHTSSSAIAAGCVMEPLTYGWMSPECMYEEVTNLHTPFSDFAWFEDQNLTRPASEERLMRGEILQIWTEDPNYHLQHCLFLMRKLYYALEHRVEWIDTKAISAEHVYHCVGQLEKLGSGERGKTLTNVNLAIYKCNKAPWFEK